jgi:hypothetical protein
MGADFGYIVSFDADTGTGKISGHFNNNSFALFSGDQVKDVKLQALLLKGSFRGLRIWFTYIDGDAPKKVANLWLHAHKIPKKEKDEFERNLNYFWLNIDLPKPQWLDSATKLLGGMELFSQLSEIRNRKIGERNDILEKERKEQKLNNPIVKEKVYSADRKKVYNYYNVPENRVQSIPKEAPNSSFQVQKAKSQEQIIEEEKEERSCRIQALCVIRKITDLIHFTHISNLPSILEHGLLGIKDLENSSISQNVRINDQMRLDNLPNAISLSISFPNYRMFYKIHQNNTSQWVIITLDPSILWKLDCVFNSSNAASGTQRSINAEIRKTYFYFEKMFSDSPQNDRSQLGIPDNFTTDPQAEVLVCEPISRSYIKSVCFSHIQNKENWQNLYHNYPSELFNNNPKFFSYRNDFSFW